MNPIPVILRTLDDAHAELTRYRRRAQGACRTAEDELALRARYREIVKALAHLELSLMENGTRAAPQIAPDLMIEHCRLAEENVT